MLHGLQHAWSRGYSDKGRPIQGVDRNYQSYEEFSWNPQLSIEDYAHLYTIKALRRKTRKVAEAYSHWIRSEDYREILTYPERGPAAFKGMIPPPMWIKEEGYKEKLRQEVEKLNEFLREIKIRPEFVQWLRNKAKGNTKDMLELAKT